MQYLTCKHTLVECSCLMESSASKSTPTDSNCLTGFHRWVSFDFLSNNISPSSRLRHKHNLANLQTNLKIHKHNNNPILVQQQLHNTKPSIKRILRNLLEILEDLHPLDHHQHLHLHNNNGHRIDNHQDSVFAGLVPTVSK